MIFLVLQRQHALAHQGRATRSSARLGEPMTKDITARPGAPRSTRAASGSPRVLRAADQRLTEVRKGIPDAGGLVIATDQDAARAYAKLLARDHRRAGHRRALRRRRGLERDRGVRRRATTAGWSPCAWCPRASTCRGSRSACTPPPSRPRCSSPRPSAASCGPGGAARRRRCSCRPSRRCSRSPTRWSVERDHALDRPKKAGEEDPYAGPRTSCWRRRTGRRTRTPARTEQCPSRRSESEAVFDRVLYDGAEFGMRRRARAARRSRTTSASPGCSSPTRCRAAAAAAGRARSAAGRGRRAPPRRWRRMRPPQAGRAAQGAVAAGGCLGAQERTAARLGAQRAATPVRRTRGGAGDPDQLHGPGRHGPRVVRRQEADAARSR